MTQSNVAAALTSAFLHSGCQSCIICTKSQKTAVTRIAYMLSTRSRDTILQATWGTECTLQTNVTGLYSGSQTVSPAQGCSDGWHDQASGADRVLFFASSWCGVLFSRS